MSDELIAALVILSWAVGFIQAWAICHDGKSLFWTSFVDGFTFRRLIRVILRRD